MFFESFLKNLAVLNTRLSAKDKSRNKKKNDQEDDDSVDINVIEPLNSNINNISKAIDAFETETGLSLKEERRILKKINLDDNLNSNYNHCIRISLAGSFSSGKSSFINSLLDSDCALAPVKDGATTRVVTRFTYGTKRKIFDKDNNELSLEEYQQKVVETKEGKNIFTIQAPAAFLKNIVLSDVPGFDSGDNGNVDSAISQKENENADVIFYLVDGNEGPIKAPDIKELIGNENSKGILNNSNKQKSLYVIITKMDLKLPSKRDVIKKDTEKELNKSKINYDDVYLYSSENKFKMPKDKSFFEEQKKILCSRIHSLASARNDYYEQRMQKSRERQIEKNKACLAEFARSLKLSYPYWLEKCKDIKQLNSFIKGKTKESLHKETSDQWNDFEMYLNKKINDIDFCKFRIYSGTIFDDYAVTKCRWEDKWDKIIESVDSYLDQNNIAPDIRGYFNIGIGVYAKNIVVEEMGKDWDGPFSSSAESLRRAFARKQNEKLRLHLIIKVREFRKSMFEKLDQDFDPLFKKQAEIETNFNNAYNTLLYSVKGE